MVYTGLPRKALPRSLKFRNDAEAAGLPVHMAIRVRAMANPCPAPNSEIQGH
jgi:hypothetical protein